MENIISSEIVKLENKNLIKTMKSDIKVATESYVEKKRLLGCGDYFEDQKIRALLISYCLLRGKEYSKMERKCQEFNPYWWNWKSLIKLVSEFCVKYSPAEEHEKWSYENIKNIFKEARKND